MELGRGHESGKLSPQSEAQELGVGEVPSSIALHRGRVGHSKGACD